MAKVKSGLQAVAAAVILLFFAWVALSWWEIGMQDPLEQPRAGRYNAFVVMTQHGETQAAPLNQAA